MGGKERTHHYRRLDDPAPAPAPVPRPRAPARPLYRNDPLDVQFRVLVIGRANAGKTSILQTLCGTTESLDISRAGWWSRGWVRARS